MKRTRCLGSPLRTAARLGAVALTLWAAAPVHAAPPTVSPPASPPTPPSVPAGLTEKLRARVAEIDRSVDGLLGLALIDLTSGERILWNADHVFPTASAIKAPILLELLRQSQQADAGQPGARLADVYTPRPEDVIPDSPMLAGLRYGTTRLCNQDLATFMIVVSDNAATNLLIDRVGMAAVNGTLQRMGLSHTRLRRKMLDGGAVRRGDENTATPRELALFYERLYKERERQRQRDKEGDKDRDKGELLDAAHHKLLWELLSLPKSGFLSAELPESVQVAHKPGSLDGARADAGVVFAPGRPFVFAGFISYAQDGRAAERALAELARRAYEHFARVGESTPHGRRTPPL
ncbi:MAG: serine hydrolase [Polyangia bacterium]